MTDYARYRGTRGLAAADARRIVLDTLGGVGRPSAWGPREPRAVVDELVAAGIADTPADDDGYRQILSLLSAALLRLAGANQASAAQTVQDRDSVELEAMVGAILERMRAQTVDESYSWPAAVASGASLRDTGASEPATSPDDTQGPESEAGPLAYLRSKFDDSLRRTVRNLNRDDDRSLPIGDRSAAFGDPRVMLDSVSYAIREGAPLDPSMAVFAATGQRTVPVVAGWSLVVDPDRLESYRQPAERAELIRAFARALDKVFG